MHTFHRLSTVHSFESEYICGQIQTMSKGSFEVISQENERQIPSSGHKREKRCVLSKTK